METEVVESTEIVKAEPVAPPEKTTFLVARNPGEMAVAQDALASWLKQKSLAETDELVALERAIKEAKAHKWNTAALLRAAKRQEKRVLFYRKCLMAVQEGYHLIPNFPIDIFAVRVERERPRLDVRSSTYDRPDVPDQEPASLPPEHGRYVSPRQLVSNWQRTEKDSKGQDRIRYLARAVEFTDPEFPIAVAHPSVMSRTGEAMAERLFDEIGVCPPTRRHGDPLVIGRIVYKNGFRRQEMSFLLAWAVNLETL